MPHITGRTENKRGSKHAPQAQKEALFGQVPPYCFYEDWRFCTVQIPVSCLTKILATSVLLTQYLNHTWSQRLAAYHASPSFLQRQVSTCVRFPPQAALHIKTLHMYVLLWMNLDQGCFKCAFFFYCCSPKPLPYVIWQWGRLMQVILSSTADVGFGFMASTRIWEKWGFLTGQNWCQTHMDNNICRSLQFSLVKDTVL